MNQWQYFEKRSGRAGPYAGNGGIMRRRLTTLAVAGLMVMAVPSAALAHECLNASRSETGSRNSANGNWVYIGEAEVVEFIAFLAGADPAAVADEFLAAVEEAGLPTSFSIFIGSHVIGANPKTGELVAAYQNSHKSNNGKGIDHAEALIGVYIDIMLSVA